MLQAGPRELHRDRVAHRPAVRGGDLIVDQHVSLHQGPDAAVRHAERRHLLDGRGVDPRDGIRLAGDTDLSLPERRDRREIGIAREDLRDLRAEGSERARGEDEVRLQRLVERGAERGAQGGREHGHEAHESDPDHERRRGGRRPAGAAHGVLTAEPPRDPERSERSTQCTRERLDDERR